MWKAREIHLVDVFKCSQPKDDFYLSTVAVNGTDAEVFCCCCGPSSVSAFGCINSYGDQEYIRQHDRKHENCELNEYPGNDFGIFGKQEATRQFLQDQFSLPAAVQQGDQNEREKRNNQCTVSSLVSLDDEREEVVAREESTLHPSIVQSTAIVEHFTTAARGRGEGTTNTTLKSKENDDLVYF